MVDQSTGALVGWRMVNQMWVVDVTVEAALKDLTPCQLPAYLRNSSQTSGKLY